MAEKGSKDQTKTWKAIHEQVQTFTKKAQEARKEQTSKKR